MAVAHKTVVVAKGVRFPAACSNTLDVVTDAWLTRWWWRHVTCKKCLRLKRRKSK